MKNSKFYDRYKDLSQQDLNNELIFSCATGNFEEAEYLISSPDLKEHADIYSNNNEAFKQAYFKGYWDIAEYFIFNCNLKKTQQIQDFIKKLPGDNSSKVENLFAIRDLNQHLEEELASDKTNKKKQKI